MQSSSQKQIHIQIQQNVEPSQKEIGEQLNNSQISQNFQLLYKKDATTISLLSPNQKKGTNLASVTQISKLLDDYGQYLNLQTSKLKSVQASKNNLQQPIKKVFENMISPLPNQYSQIQYNFNQLLQQNGPRKKFRSNSNHQPSQKNKFNQDMCQTNRNNEMNQDMISRINANKIYQTFNNQDGMEANASSTNLEQINQTDRNGIQQVNKQNYEVKQSNNVSYLPLINSPKIKHCYLSPKNKLKSLTRREYNKQLSKDCDKQQDSSQSLKIIKREQPNEIKNLRNQNAYKRDIYLNNEIFNEQDDFYKLSNTSPIQSTRQYSQNSPNQQGYSNLLKQNTKVCQQFIVPKIKYKSYSSNKNKKHEYENSEENSKDEINSFQQSLANQQDPSNFNFINLSGGNSIFANSALSSPKRKEEEYFDGFLLKQYKERPNKSMNKSRNNQVSRFLPQINSPTNLQQGDSQTIGSSNNQPTLIQEQIKQSKDIYGKKYFKNLKIESLIKEYEKRSIKSIFDLHIPLSAKRNKQEINNALEEKKQKEQKQLSQNQQNKRSKSDILKNNKDNEQKAIQNIKAQLSKSALTNKLEQDLKNFRERTKSSLIKGYQEFFQNDFKIDSQSVVQGQAIQQQSSNQKQYLKSNKNDTFIEYGISQFSGQNVNYSNNMKYQNTYIKRGSNSLDIAINQQYINPNQDISILTNKSIKQAPKIQDFLKYNSNNLYSEENDILDNFLKNIKKKQVKTLETQNSSHQSPIRSDPKQYLILKPIQPETLQQNDQEKLDPQSIQESDEINKDQNEQKISYIQPNSTTSKQKNKKKKWNFNQKTVGQENINYGTYEISNGGWETKTNSNFDQLYSLF